MPLAFPKPKDRKLTRVEAVVQYPDGRQVCTDSAAGRREYRRRVQLMWAIQKGKCGLQIHPECQKYPWIPVEEATFDHGEPRGMGAARRDDRPFVNGNCAACGLCNAMKGSRRLEML